MELFMQEKPLLTNEQILALRDASNELCVAVNTHQMFLTNNETNFSWDHLVARKKEAWDLLTKLNL